MTESVKHWSEQPAEQSGNVTRQRLQGAGATLVRVVIPAGTEAPSHEHPHEQFVEVISGAGTLTTDAGEQPFAAGDIFHFPKHTAHAAFFREPTVLLEINLPD